jgi:hypothetical protein
MVATNSGKWYVGDKPVVAAYNKGEQVYPLTTDPEPPVGKTYNISRSAVGVFDITASSPAGFSHYNTVPSGQLSGYKYTTMWKHKEDSGAASEYFPTRNIGWNFWDHMLPDGTGATAGYEAVNCYRSRQTARPTPSANWYEYTDFYWEVSDLSKTPEYLMKMINLDFSFTTNPSFISSSSLYHCYPYDVYHIHGVPNREITTDDINNLKLTQKDYLGFGSAWSEVTTYAAQQIAWINLPWDAFDWTLASDGEATFPISGLGITFMISVWGDGNELEAPENPRGEYPLPA